MNWLCFLIQPSSQLTPPTKYVTCDKHHACSVAPHCGPHAQQSHHIPFTFVTDLKKSWRKKNYDCRFPPCPIWAEVLWCVGLYVSKQHSAGFSYLTALQHPVGKPLCRMPLQGMVFVGAWVKATTSNPLLVRKLCIQVCNFTDMIQTRSKAYWGALVHS